MDKGYIDISYYDRVVGNKSLKSMDYFHARVTNNPQYSNVLVQEAYSHFYPKFDQVRNFGEIEVTQASSEESASSTQSYVSNPRAQQSPEKSADFELLVECVLKEINKLDHSDNLRKCFAYYLVQCNMYTSNPLLATHIAHFKSILFLKFSDLSAYIGTRWAAERDRRTFREVFKQILEEGQ